MKLSRHAIPAALIAATFIAQGLFAATAQAQITPAVLIGDAVADADDSKYADVAAAIERFTNKDALSAKALLESAKRKNDELPPVDMMLAKMYLVSGNTQAFVVSLENAIKEAPNDPEPFLIMADQSLATSQAISASALYDRSIELLKKYDKNPRRKQRFVERAYKGRSAVYQRWENWEAAEADLREWIKANEEEDSAYSRLGFVLFQLGREKEGYEAFVQAKKLNADLPSAYVSAASMYQRLNNSDKAKQAFEAAYNADKNDKTTVIAFAEWLIRENQLDQALSVLTAGAKSNPDVYQIALLSAVAYQMKNQPEAAEREYNRTLELAPGNRDAMNHLALLLLTQDEQAQERAETLAKINAKLHDRNSNVFITLAWILHKRGKGNEANQAFRRGVELGSMSADSTLLVAKILNEQGKNKVAKDVLTNAMDKERGIFVNRAEAEALLKSL